MQAIVLLPMIVCIVALFRRPLTQVFLWVYLPVMLLLPTYFVYKGPGLPPLDFSEAVLLPLGIAAAWRLLPTWKPTLTDIWMGVFLLSSAASHFRAHETTQGWFNLFHTLCEAVAPYLLGKLLIEQFDLRLQTARRFVYVLAAASIVSLVEYVRGRNPFVLLWSRFFPDQPLIWETQMRWGFGRVAGPFGQSELAGMVLLVALVLAIWVSYSHPWPDKFRWVPHPFRQRTILFAVLVVTLFTTQARGPWLGCMLAVPIALLGRTRHLLRNGTVLFMLCLFAGAAVYVKGSVYTQTQVKAETDEQQTAQYRRQLLDDYVPIAAAGGAWGWGEKFPVVSTSTSIDNEYLFLWLTQGWVGLVSFLAIAGDTLVRLLRAIVRSTGKRDRFFALTLLGAFCGLLLTVGTVFLSQQPYQIFFLLAGWAQSVRTVTTQREERKLAFAHALT